MTSLLSASTYDNERCEEYEEERRKERQQSDQMKGHNVKTYAKKRYMFNLFGFKPDFFIIPLLLFNIVMIDWHLLSIMKNVKNTNKKDERKDNNQIKQKGIMLK